MSTTAHSEVTVPESSCMALSMTLSSMMCLTSFFSRDRYLSFCWSVTDEEQQLSEEEVEEVRILELC